MKRYPQRGPLEHTFFRPFPRLVLGCINANFYDQGRIFHHFSSSTCFAFAPFQISDFSSLRTIIFCKIWRIFADFHRREQMLQIFVKFERIFSGISHNLYNFAMSDAKIAIF
jgi:hypothetical protein